MTVKVALRQIESICEAIEPLVDILVPYKTIAYLRQYFHTLHQYESGRRSLTTLKVVWVLFAAKIAQCAYISMMPLSHLARVLLLDYFHLIHLPSEFNLNMIILLVLTCYYYHMAYVQCRNNSSVTTAYQVAVLGDTHIFNATSYANWPVGVIHADTHVSVTEQQCRDWLSKAKVIFVQKLALGTLNMLQILILVTILFMVMSQAILVNTLHHNVASLVPSLWQQWVVAIMVQVNAFHFYFCLFAMLHVCNLLTTVSVIVSSIIFVQLKQLHQRLDGQRCAGVSKRPVTWQQLGHFVHHHTKCLLLVFSLDRLYGNMLLGFLLVHCPLSSSLLVSLLLGKIPQSQWFFTWAILFGQLFSLIGSHLMATRFPDKIHDPAKKLISANLRQTHEPHSLRNRMKITHCIFNLYTENQYGITYGKLSIIKLGTFLKFLLIYSQIMMYAYMLLR